MNTRRPSRWRRARADGRWAVLVLFLPPALLLFTLFVAWPMAQAAWYSGFRWNGYGAPTEWLGLQNFRWLLQDEAFATALRNNGLVIAVSLLLQLPLALGLALLLTEQTRSSWAFRLVFFLPYMVAEVAAALLWRFVFDADSGLVAHAWQAFGAEPPVVLGEPGLAMAALLVVVVWKYLGFHMMLFIGALQQIDRSLLEAARIDGATRWQLLRLVKLPLMAPTLRLSVFFAVLGSLQLFDLVMPLTQGGPSNSTHTLVSYLYSFGLTRMDIGYGSAVGVLLFLLCAGFAFGYQRWVMKPDLQPAGALR